MDVPKNYPKKPADFALHFWKAFYVKERRYISALFQVFFYLTVRAYVVTVVDSFTYWFLCEAEKEH